MVPLAPRGRGRAILWGQRVLAIPSGALLVLALPPVSAWWLGFIGAAPALVIWRSAQSGPDAAVRGAFAGAGFFGLVFHWLIRHVGVFSLPMAFALGLLWAPLGWIAWRALRPPLSPARAAAALAVVPSAWVAVEFARSWDRLAGPWGVLGASQWQVQPVLALASLGGVWALSFLLALTSTAATIAAAPDAPRLARGGALAAAALALGGAVTYSAVRLPPPTVGELRVTAVQPGLIADPQERFAWQLQQTRDAAGEGTDLIVWGQRSVPYDIQAHPQIQAEIAAAARTAGASLLVQSDILGDDGYRRTALLVGADGVAARYDKMRLVPFGEYVPLRGLLGWVTGQTAAPQIDLVRGREQAVLEVAGARVGALISYESQFPDLRRRLAGMGAEAIVALGSMSGFHGTWAQPQQASIEAVRAVESGRAGLQSSLNGISVAFDANGETLLWVAPHQRGAYTVDLPLRRGLTPYVRFGDWVPALSGAILLAAGARVGSARLSGR